MIGMIGSFAIVDEEGCTLIEQGHNHIAAVEAFNQQQGGA